jgi:hypothetical protein
MYRVIWCRDDGCAGNADFDNNHDAQVVFDFVVGMFDTDYATLSYWSGDKGWLRRDTFGDCYDG